MTASGRMCTQCVMDESDSEIRFDEAGICNHCHEYDTAVRTRSRAGHLDLDALVDRIRRDGRVKAYDCVIGVSGGVDSSYVAHLARELGLRPIAVHLDNGWDSELATENIRNVLERLDIDLLTHVVDWEEFRRLQLAFVEASVVDIELLTDNAILAILHSTARAEGVRHILLGNNYRTELTMPKGWNHPKGDVRNLRAIARRHGDVPIRTLPTISTLGLMASQYVRRIESHSILDFIEYDRAAAVRVLTDDLGWRSYGGKHEESFFTKVYQRMILPEKFGIDKRRAHLSNMINSRQLDRAAALTVLEEPLYTPAERARDRAFLLRKWGVEEADFDVYLRRPARRHDEYPTDARYVSLLRAGLFPVLRATKPLRKAPPWRRSGRAAT